MGSYLVLIGYSHSKSPALTPNITQVYSAVTSCVLVNKYRRFDKPTAIVEEFHHVP